MLDLGNISEGLIPPYNFSTSFSYKWCHASYEQRQLGDWHYPRNKLYVNANHRIDDFAAY
jgi:hypothetical protein